MLRTVFIYLLIAEVLCCPYLCLGEAVDESVVPYRIGGHCCSEKHAEPGSQPPQLPHDGGHDCLCQRAIVDGIRPLELDLVTPPAITWSTGDTLPFSLALSCADASSEPPHHFPPFTSGRDICTLRCLLLI